MIRYLFFFFFPTLLIMQSCNQEAQKYDNVFYWNIESGITSMDPAFARAQSNIWVVTQIFNGLVTLDDSLKVVGDLAKSWEISPDGLQYIFHLRNDVHFQDHPIFKDGKGRKFVASDVVYSFNRIMNPKVASPGAWLFNDKVKKDGNGNYAFTALNDTTVQIELVKPFRPFLQLLSLKYASIVPKEIVEHYGKDFRAHPVGTGAFALLFNYEGEKIVLKKNPRYFEKEQGKPLPYLDRVVISFVPGKQNEYFSFIKGDLSLLSGLDASFKDNLLTRKGDLKDKYKGAFQFEKAPFLNTEYLGILTDTAILGNHPLRLKKIRQAMSYGIDRQKMIRFLRNNIGIPGNYGFVPPVLLKSNSYYDYNPSKARALIAEVGFANKLVTGIKLVTTQQYLEMAVYVQHQLKEIGIQVEIENVPPSSLSEWKAQSKALFFRGSWIADYADPENYLSLFYSKNFSPGGPNYFHYKNERFDQLFEQSLQEPDEEKRNEMYLKMQDIMMEDAPVIVLFYDEIVRLKANKVMGLHPNAINLIELKKVRLN